MVDVEKLPNVVEELLIGGEVDIDPLFTEFSPPELPPLWLLPSPPGELLPDPINSWLSYHNNSVSFYVILLGYKTQNKA